MAVYNHDAGIKLGLKLAAEHLIKTAQDYEQMAAQVQKGVVDCKYSLHRTAELARVATYKAQALLLRGQAAAVLEVTL